MKNTTFKLMGGVGNQLFIYHAAKFYESKSGFPVRFDVTDVSNFRNTHNGDMRKIINNQNIFISSRALGIYNEIQRKALKFVANENLDRLVKYYNFNEIGYEPKLLEVPNGSSVHGYFQSYKYVENIDTDLITNLEKASLNSWITPYLNKVSKLNILGVHIRRGDYAKLKEEIGILDIKYYIDLIGEITNSVNVDEIWVFSDEMQHVKANFNPINFKVNMFFIEPPKDSDPLLLLNLMSKLSNLVMANSTFSWWAAKINSEQIIKNVYSPSKWFRSLADPKYLIPQDWILVDSIWEKVIS